MEFDGLGTIVVANRGDGAVYVSDLRADTGPFSFVRRVGDVIQPGDLGVFQPDSTFASRGLRYGVPSPEWHIPPRDSASSYRDPTDCNTILVVSESSPSFRLWAAAMGEDLPLFEDPAEVVIRYHGIESGVSYEDTLAVPAVAGLNVSCS